MASAMNKKQPGKEPTAFVPPERAALVLARLANYMVEGTRGGLRRPGDPEIAAFTFSDDRGGTGYMRLRVPGIWPSALKRIVGFNDIEVWWEYD